MLTNSELEYYRKAWHNRRNTDSLEAEVRVLVYKRLWDRCQMIPLRDAKVEADKIVAKIKGKEAK